jgi:hypothetical protein
VDIAESRIISPLCGGELALLRTPNCYPQHCGHCENPHHFRVESQLLPTTLWTLRNPASFRRCVAGSWRFCGIPIVTHNIAGITESRIISEQTVPNRHAMVAG